VSCGCESTTLSSRRHFGCGRTRASIRVRVRLSEIPKDRSRQHRSVLKSNLGEKNFWSYKSGGGNSLSKFPKRKSWRDALSPSPRVVLSNVSLKYPVFPGHPAVVSGDKIVSALACFTLFVTRCRAVQRYVYIT